MDIIYFDKDKRELPQYDRRTEKAFFKFFLRICRKEVIHQFETYMLEDEKYGQTVSQSSDFHFIEKGKEFYHSFGECSWIYDCSKQQCFIINLPINI